MGVTKLQLPTDCIYLKKNKLTTRAIESFLVYLIWEKHYINSESNFYLTLPQNVNDFTNF